MQADIQQLVAKPLILSKSQPFKSNLALKHRGLQDSRELSEYSSSHFSPQQQILQKKRQSLAKGLHIVNQESSRHSSHASTPRNSPQRNPQVSATKGKILRRSKLDAKESWESLVLRLEETQSCANQKFKRVSAQVRLQYQRCDQKGRKLEQLRQILQELKG